MILLPNPHQSWLKNMLQALHYIYIFLNTMSCHFWWISVKQAEKLSLRSYCGDSRNNITFVCEGSQYYFSIFFIKVNFDFCRRKWHFLRFLGLRNNVINWMDQQALEEKEQHKECASVKVNQQQHGSHQRCVSFLDLVIEDWASNCPWS